jgi:uncharacterized protein YqjF (DUF2071 family)
MALVEEHDLPLFHRALRCHATIEDMAVVTWAVPPDTLEGRLPTAVVPRTWRTPFGERALLSTVAYRYRNLWFRAAPFLPLRAVQVHHRLHVDFRGEHGVWFLGTWMDSPYANVPRRLWGMPWWRSEIGLAATWESGRLVDHRTVVGEGEGQGAIHLEAPTDDDRVPPAIAELVVNPAQGWWKRTAGPHVGALAVGHRPQKGHQASVVTAGFHPLVAAGMVSDEAQPWFARVVRNFELAVGTPPRTICLRRGEQ